jgi:hypothetical protein
VIEWDEEFHKGQIQTLTVIAEVNCPLKRWSRIVVKSVDSIETKMAQRLKTALIVQNKVNFRLFIKHNKELVLKPEEEKENAALGCKPKIPSPKSLYMNLNE